MPSRPPLGKANVANEPQRAPSIAEQVTPRPRGNHPARTAARKKTQTRLAISNVATQLFIERGFDHVTIAEVAAAANVSVNTIFNYFANKEELFFDRGEEVAEEPSRIVRDRR